MTTPEPLRWPTRQMQRSIGVHLQAALTDLGWLADGHPNTEHLVDYQLDHDTEGLVADGGPKEQNIIGLSVGQVPDVKPEEIGQGLVSVSVPMFFDIYGENRPTALNISDDVMGVLTGELWTPTRYVPLYDHSQDPPTLVVDRAMEVRHPESRWASDGSGLAVPEWRRRWRVVAFTATMFFNSAGVGA